MKYIQTSIILLCLILLSACSKEDAFEVVSKAPRVLVISLDFDDSIFSTPDKSSRAIVEKEKELLPAFELFKITLFDKEAEGNIIKEILIKATEIKDNKIIISHVPSRTKAVEVRAKVGEPLNITNETRIEDLQDVEFKRIPFSGFTNKFTTNIISNSHNPNHLPPHHINHLEISGEVVIKPLLSRIEVSGQIDVNEKDNGVYKVEVERVYLNNYWRFPTEKADRGEIIYLEESEPSLWEGKFAGSPMADDYFTIGPNQAVAYNIYPTRTYMSDLASVEAFLPHLILKVKVYTTKQDFDDQKPEEFKRYITIRSFKKGGKLINYMEPGVIYHLNLKELSQFFKPGGEGELGHLEPTDPTDMRPEARPVDFVLEVKVSEWKEVDMMPGFDSRDKVGS